MVWEGCSPLQIGLGFLGVLPKGTVNLLVEVGIPVIDEIHIFVCMELAPPAVGAALILPTSKTIIAIEQSMHHYAQTRTSKCNIKNDQV